MRPTGLLDPVFCHACPVNGEGCVLVRGSAILVDSSVSGRTSNHHPSSLISDGSGALDMFTQPAVLILKLHLALAAYLCVCVLSGGLKS